MKLRLVPILISLLFVGGCATRHTLEFRSSEEINIRETALLHELAFRDTNRVVFVSFSDSQGHPFDPLSDFLQRLHAAGIPAREGSQSSMDSRGGVADKVTGESGVVYSAGIIRWISDSRVEVRRACHAGNLAGGATHFIMKKKGDKWQETKTTRQVIY